MRFVKCLALVILLTATLAGAIDPSTVQFKPSTLKPQPHEKVAPYWTAETGWHTELQLRNNLLTGDLVVTTVLRLSDGTEIKLSPVTIPAGTVTTIDVMQELNKVAPQWVHAPGSFGSVSFQYTSVSVGNLYAVAMVHMDGQPIGYHIDASTTGKQSIAGSREGIWWLPHAGVSDYLVITNSSQQAATGTLSIYDASGKESQSTISLPAHQTVRVVVSQLVSAAKLTGNYGGIKFAVPNSAREIDSLHFLYDPTAGFSALMKMFYFDGTAKLEQRTWAGNTQWTMWAPMLALKNPDPMLAFPAGTTLQPFVFLRNTTSQTIAATVTVGWRATTVQGKATLPSINLNPFQTLKLDIGGMQSQLGIPDDAHWGLVTLTTPASPDALLAVAASYDSTGRYGAQTPFSDQLADHWEGGLWQVDSTHNSIIAVTNGGTKATDALLTFLYNGGNDKYEVQKTIAPGDQLWLNLGDLIHNAVPDKNGKVFPASLTSGTYNLQDLKPPKSLAGSLFEGKIIVDKTWGHLTYGCMQCCGYAPMGLSPSPFGLPVTISGFQNPMVADLCFGTEFASGFPTSWFTDSPPIASVVQDGTLTGNAAGNTYNHGSGLLQSGDGEDVTPPRQCPIENQMDSGGVNVDDFQMSPAQVIDDGSQGSFSMTILNGTAQSYQWSWSAPQGAGNNPNVNFTAATAAQTNTDGHWFASPNVVCAPMSSVYTITGKVHFSDGQDLSKNTTLTVNVPWDVAGQTSNPPITGGPSTGYDPVRQLWVVLDKGTWTRGQPNVQIFVPASSQFYNKTVAHENKHAQQWISGLMSDLYQIEGPGSAMEAVSSVTDPDYATFSQKLLNAFNAWANNQSAQADARKPQAETEAHAVSDPIAPQYLYQNSCGSQI